MWVRELLAGVLIGIKPVSKEVWSLDWQEGMLRVFSLVEPCRQSCRSYNIQRSVYANGLIKMTPIAIKYGDYHELDTPKCFTCVVCTKNAGR